MYLSEIQKEFCTTVNYCILQNSFLSHHGFVYVCNDVYLTVIPVTQGFAPLYQYKKPSTSTTSPIFNCFTA